MNATQDLAALLNWSEPQPLRTSRGPRLLRKAEPNGMFWSIWRSSKTELQAAGISVSKREGNWEVCWWQEISESVVPVSAITKQRVVASCEVQDGTAPEEGAPEKGSPAATDSVFQATESIFGKRTKSATSMEVQPTPGLPAGVVLSWEQLAIHDWMESGTGNLVVEARAGTGKTFTITYGFARCKEQDILYVVFGKKNEREAKEKISDPRVTIRTLNALGFRFCSSVWRGIKPDDDVELDRILAVAKDIPEEASGSVERLVAFAKNTFIEVPSISALVLLANERGVFCPLQNENGEEEFPVERLATIARDAMQYALDNRDSKDRISFNDQVWLAVAKHWVRPVADLVVVDETQDMNTPQLVMVQRSVRKTGRICVVGDARQCIFGFRGAHPDGMGMMRKALNATVKSLTITRRCPKVVVRLVNPIVPDYQAAADAPEGELNYINEGELLERLAVGDAVVSRANAPLMPLCLALLRKGVSARIEGRDIGVRLTKMVRQFKAKSVPDFMRKVEHWCDKQRKRLEIRKQDKNKIAAVEDDAATLFAVAEGCANILEIEQRIKDLFQDSDNNPKPAVILSSTHKAKGLEFPRVSVLSWTFRKSWKGQTPAAAREEDNLWYVACTRAKQVLNVVSEGGRNKPANQPDGTKAGAI